MYMHSVVGILGNILLTSNETDFEFFGVLITDNWFAK